jgi:hypothetical protein
MFIYELKLSPRLDKGGKIRFSVEQDSIDHEQPIHARSSPLWYRLPVIRISGCYCEQRPPRGMRR